MQSCTNLTLTKNRKEPCHHFKVRKHQSRQRWSQVTIQSLSWARAKTRTCSAPISWLHQMISIKGGSTLKFSQNAIDCNLRKTRRARMLWRLALELCLRRLEKTAQYQSSRRSWSKYRWRTKWIWVISLSNGRSDNRKDFARQDKIRLIRLNSKTRVQIKTSRLGYSSRLMVTIHWISKCRTLVKTNSAWSDKSLRWLMELRQSVQMIEQERTLWISSLVAATTWKATEL